MAQAVTSIVRDRAGRCAARCRRIRSKPSSRCSGGLLLDNAAWDRIADLSSATTTSTAPTTA